MASLRAKGHRGDWFARLEGAGHELDGEVLPCVHKHWLERGGKTYVDPWVDDDNHWPEFIEAIRSGGKVILTKDFVTDNGANKAPSFRREPNGYIAVWSVTDVTVSGNVLRFRLVDRLANL